MDTLTANQGVTITSSNPEVFIGRGLSRLSSLDSDTTDELVIPSYFGLQNDGFIVRAADIQTAFIQGDDSLVLESLFDVEAAP